jgi:type I restriction enzyme S subunit
LASITTGSGDTQDADGGHYPFIVRSETPLGSSEYTFDTEAILTAGDGAVGEVFHHITGKFHAHQRVYVLHDFAPFVHPRFLYRYFSTFFRLMAQDGSARTTVDSVRRWMLTDLPVAMPPMREQQVIADFLDRETAEIDAFIADQERLIELLNERRAGVVSRLILEGAGRHELVSVPDRPWLGRHPTNWPILPLRAFLTETNERAGSDWSNLPLLSVSIHAGVIPRAEVTDRISRAEDFSKYRVCNQGDLALNRMRAFQGGLGVSGAKGLISPDYMVCRLSDAVEPTYCHHLLRTPSFVAQMTRALRGLGDAEQGATRTPRINPRDFLRCVVALPPRVEQVRILRVLEGELAGVDAVCTATQEAITLSKERRAALISAAVTGQLDVGGRHRALRVSDPPGRVEATKGGEANG